MIHTEKRSRNTLIIIIIIIIIIILIIIIVAWAGPDDGGKAEERKSRGALICGKWQHGQKANPVWTCFIVNTDFDLFTITVALK